MTISDIRPLALKFQRPTVRPVGPEHFSLSVTSLFSTFNHLYQKITGRRAVASSRTRISLASLNPRHSPEDLLASDCHRLGHGFKARLPPSSYRMLPRRRPGARFALRVGFIWGNMRDLEQTFHLTKLQSTGAKVRTVELTGNKLPHPNETVHFPNLKQGEGRQRNFFLQQRGNLSKPLDCVKTMGHSAPFNGRMQKRLLLCEGWP